MAKIITGVEILECTPEKNGKVHIFRNGIIERQEINVKTFKDINGNQINIGMTDEIQMMVGLPFKWMKEIEKKVEEKTIDRMNFNSVIKAASLMTKIFIAIKDATFSQRLKYLFGGELIDIKKIVKDL